MNPELPVKPTDIVPVETTATTQIEPVQTIDVWALAMQSALRDGCL